MKKYIILFLILTLPLLNGCDYLDVTPPNVITDEQVYSSESGVVAALTKLYIDLPVEDLQFDSKEFTGDSYWLNLEILVGHALNRKGDDVVVNEGFRGDMGANRWDYGVIRNINKFILNIQQTTAISEEKKKMYEAEALVLRAWNYFAMAKRYGGVPIVDQLLAYDGPESIEALEIPRSSEKELWDFILSDIDNALQKGIPETIQNGRVNRYAALTLKAQAALYAASIAKYNDITLTDPNTNKQVCGIPAQEANNYFRAAEAACQEIISSGKYELARSMNTSNLSENFRLLFLKPDSHKEAIFSRYYSYPDKVYALDNYCLPWGRHNNPASCPTVDLLERFEFLDGRPGSDAIPSIGGFTQPCADRLDFFAGRDARLLATILAPGETFQGYYVDIKYGEIDANGQEQTSSEYRGLYGMGNDTETPSSMFRKKHLDDSKLHSMTEADSDQPFIAMRYAEVLLMMAEAKVELGKPGEAKPYINDIRTRAGLKEINEVTLDEVRNQYACEMAYENKTFWNYRRWRIYDSVMRNAFQPRGLFPFLDTRTNQWVYKVEKIGKGEFIFQNRYYYNQINGDEIKKNKNLIQNYGY
ncbi:RagB/SusD family nutrient uptake outer membrane protein [Parabacteroides sp. OttesenSCG-928-N08]|nr:RagB/SusD family nutrient uptake outer membrane protein [Parabacteroides sp. OttesenSCG-928-N08]